MKSIRGFFEALRKLACDERGGFNPQISGQSGLIGTAYGPSTDIVSPQNIVFGPNNPDTWTIPTTWAAAGTLSLLTFIDGAFLTILDPKSKLTAGNTLTITDAGSRTINNAASLVLNAAGAGALLRATASATVTGWSAVTVP